MDDLEFGGEGGKVGGGRREVEAVGRGEGAGEGDSSRARVD